MRKRPHLPPLRLVDARLGDGFEATADGTAIRRGTPSAERTSTSLIRNVPCNPWQMMGSRSGTGPPGVGAGPSSPGRPRVGSGNVPGAAIHWTFSSASFSSSLTSSSYQTRCLPLSSEWPITTAL